MGVFPIPRVSANHKHNWNGRRCSFGRKCGGIAARLNEIMSTWHRLYWLDYDAVALAVLVIGMGMIALLTLII
jgi:hypothetical protein